MTRLIRLPERAPLLTELRLVPANRHPRRGRPTGLAPVVRLRPTRPAGPPPDQAA